MKKAKYKICILPDHVKDMSWEALDWTLDNWNRDPNKHNKIYAGGEGNKLQFLILEIPQNDAFSRENNTCLNT